jgi:hypothetical protein
MHLYCYHPQLCYRPEVDGVLTVQFLLLAPEFFFFSDFENFCQVHHLLNLG